MDFTFQIDPGPVVLILSQGYHVSRGVLKKEIPGLRGECCRRRPAERRQAQPARLPANSRALRRQRRDSQGKRPEDAAGDLPDRSRPAAQTGDGGDRRATRIFSTLPKLRSYLQIQPASRFLSHGRYSEALLKSDVATLRRPVPLQRLSRCADRDQSRRQLPGHRPTNSQSTFIIDEGVEPASAKFKIMGNEQ